MYDAFKNSVNVVHSIKPKLSQKKYIMPYQLFII